MSQHPLHALRRRRFGIFLTTALALATWATGPAQAAWSNGNWTDVFVSTAEIDGLDVATDGNGGTLAMILDPGPFPYRARYSKLNRAGTEVWGDGGIQAPFDVLTQNQYRPVAIENDGNGGAYCVYQEWYGVTGVFHLVRLDATGTQLWSVDVATAANSPGTAGVQLVFEPGIGITVGHVESSSRRLYATRYDADGNLLWSTDVNLFYHYNIHVAPTGGYTEYDMQPDGQGGVLFAWYRYDLAAFQSTNGLYFEQIGAQRIDSNGNRLWGSDGHQVWQQPGFWHTNAFGARIVDDGAGGAYVVTSGGTKAYGQHLNAAGSETWATNGIVLQDTGGGADNISTYPRICRDTAGGFFLVQHRFSIFATRIDINGQTLWGTPGIIVSQAVDITEYMDSAAIDADGFGGAVLGYHDWHDGTESLGGARIDGFGNVLWNAKTLFTASGNDRIEDVHVVADGIGGAQYVWKRHVWDAPRKHDVYALGVNSQGGPPEPVLYGMLPEAGEPGDVLSTLVLGDYIDGTFDYDLRRDASSYPITGLSELASNLIGGWLDLSGAELGAYDLFAAHGGGDRGTLANAFGVGYRTDCPYVVPATNNQAPDMQGSDRKMAFSSSGGARFAYLLQSPSTNESMIYGGHRSDSGLGRGLLERYPGFVVSDLAFTVDSHDRENYVYVRNDDELVSHTYDWNVGGLVASRTIEQTFSTPLSRPVVAPMQNGTTRIVVQLDNMGVAELWQAWDDGLGLNVDHVPHTGTNAHDADLAVTADGLVMVYVRDTWLPGVSELCVQHLRNGTWETPTVLTFALHLASPSVACDREGNVLVAWILDNTANNSAPALQTTLISSGTVGPIRTRATDGYIYRVQVDAQGPGRYFMLTQETGQPMQIFLRGGDGRVFYPKQLLNSENDSDWPSFAVQFGGLRVAAMWNAYGNPTYGDRLMTTYCNAAVMTAAPQEPPNVGSSGIEAYPNPFNPRTQLQFELSSTQWVKVAIFDSRGRLVRSLHDGTLPVGAQSLEFDGRDEGGNILASGVYFAQVRPSSDAPKVVKLTLLK